MQMLRTVVLDELVLGSTIICNVTPLSGSPQSGSAQSNVSEDSKAVDTTKEMSYYESAKAAAFRMYDKDRLPQANLVDARLSRNPTRSTKQPPRHLDE